MSLRTILTDNLWKRLAYLLDRTGRVYNKPEHRNTVEGILYRIHIAFVRDALGVIYLLNLACETRFIVGSIFGLKRVFGKKC